ncbi:MAG: hypothetical protein HKN74_05210 [Acidimicrobiia bacterium]|nr:hypothetical protein [Acidimicrobiia bacterium]MBT8217637.1 hypothetical protein [Acidimicrobiia bacterium]NNF09666.1 hypothetical protein [Acidimicrobiia bacterium]NNL68763.1 hypothetical protein [Acidimicrobiia bacterium]
MSRLEAALSALAERGDPIGPDVLLRKIEEQMTGESARELVALTTKGRAMQNMPTTTEPMAWWRRPRVALGAGFVALVVAVLLVVSLSGPDEPDAAGSPEEVLTEYRDAYNAGDIDAIMALFTDQSTVTGFPGEDLEPRPPTTGIDALRLVHLFDLSHAANEDAYTFYNIEVNGTTITWDHEWKSNEGLRGCGQGHSAVVEDGKFASWVFAEFGFC